MYFRQNNKHLESNTTEIQQREHCKNFQYINIYIYIYTSGKGSLLAFQRVLNDSCEPERWYIQRTDEENTIYLVLRVSCYQSSAK